MGQHFTRQRSRRVRLNVLERRRNCPHRPNRRGHTNRCNVDRYQGTPWESRNDGASHRSKPAGMTASLRRRHRFKKLVEPRSQPDIVRNTRLVVKAHAVDEGDLMCAGIRRKRVLHHHEVVATVLRPAVSRKRCPLPNTATSPACSGSTRLVLRDCQLGFGSGLV